ncbi:MAG: 3-keto-disaccharide hydrolase [Limisphaerales bacterium]
MKNSMLDLTTNVIASRPAAGLSSKEPAPRFVGGTRLRRLGCGLVAGLALLATNPLAAQTPSAEEGFVSLFDGKTLNGWKVGDNAVLFHVEDGMIVMNCPADDHRPAHLFYDGEINNHTFKNFDLRVEVMTYRCANSGIYFHTEFQNEGFPKKGLECQVDNSHVDWRRTGSLYGLINLTWGPETPSADNKQTVIYLANSPLKDEVWYTQEIICRDGLVTVKLNGQPMFTYQIPEADSVHRLSSGATWLPEGTFALQGHPPMPGQISKACFRNIRVKVLPD